MERSEITFDCGRLYNFKFTAFLIFVSLLIGYFNQTSIYAQFNSLPPNRTVLTPIKNVNVSISDGNVARFELLINSITHETVENFIRNYYWNVSSPVLSFRYGGNECRINETVNGDLSQVCPIPMTGNIIMTPYLFQLPLSEPINKHLDIHIIYPSRSLIDFQTNSAKFWRVCISNSRLITFFHIPVYPNSNYPIPLPILNNISLSYQSYINLTHPLEVEVPSLLYTQNLFGRSEQYNTMHLLQFAQKRSSSFFYIGPKNYYANLLGGRTLDGKENVCFKEVSFEKENTDSELPAFEIGQKVEERKVADILILKGNRTITNSMELNSFFKKVCRNCSIMELVSEDTPKIASAMRGASISVGFGGEELIHALAMRENGVVVDIRPGKMKCSSWLDKIAAAAKLKTVIIEGESEECAVDCESSRCLDRLSQPLTVDIQKLQAQFVGLGL